MDYQKTLSLFLRLNVFFSIYLKKSQLYQHSIAKDACSLYGSLKFQKISAALIVNIIFSQKIVLASGVNGFILKAIACFCKGKILKHCIDIGLLLQSFKFNEVTSKNHQKLEAELKIYQMLSINKASNTALPGDATSIKFSYTISDKVVNHR